MQVKTNNNRRGRKEGEKEGRKAERKEWLVGWLETQREMKRKEEKRNTENDACSNFPGEMEIPLFQVKNYFSILSEIT